MAAQPELTAENEAFWAGGADGALMIARCGTCDKAIHPPQPICPQCLSTDVAPHRARGTGTIVACTVNRQQWAPDMAVPYVLAVVALDGEDGVRITARVESDPDRVAIGDRVQVAFAPLDELWRPYFVPMAD